MYAPKPLRPVKIRKEVEKKFNEAKENAAKPKPKPKPVTQQATDLETMKAQLSDMVGQVDALRQMLDEREQMEAHLSEWNAAWKAMIAPNSFSNRPEH